MRRRRASWTCGGLSLWLACACTSGHSGQAAADASDVGPLPDSGEDASATSDGELGESMADGAAVDATGVDASRGEASADESAGDARAADAGAEDGGAADTAASDAPTAYPRPDYHHLGETGLFASGTTTTLSTNLLAFEPTYKLWSDGANKRRWVRLPSGTAIDTHDMDHWVFPVGTKVWKEFSLGGVLLETRLIERYGTGPDDYWMGAFVWNADQTDAVFMAAGQQNILGTPHDAPQQSDCGACHRGDAGRVLGLSAIQMSRTGGSSPTLRDLAAMGLLSAPPTDTLDYPVPGDAVTAAALGYLHANCGHCHNLEGTAWPDTQMVLRLTVADRDASHNPVVESTVGVGLEYWRGGTIHSLVVAGQPDQSAIVARMSTRVLVDQMPPLATEFVDSDGVAAVRTWITALTP